MLSQPHPSCFLPAWGRDCVLIRAPQGLARRAWGVHTTGPPSAHLRLASRGPRPHVIPGVLFSTHHPGKVGASGGRLTRLGQTWNFSWKDRSCGTPCFLQASRSPSSSGRVNWPQAAQGLAVVRAKNTQSYPEREPRAASRWAHPPYHPILLPPRRLPLELVRL